MSRQQELLIVSDLYCIVADGESPVAHSALFVIPADKVSMGS